MHFRALMVAALFSACVRSNQIVCDDGRVCPEGTTCDIDHGLCLVDAQTAACDDKLDGDRCMFGEQSGVCDRGVCLPTACGDGALDVGELCDDGNTESNDGCRGDCQKVESWPTTMLVGGSTQATAFSIQPVDVALDAQGDRYIADWNNHQVHRVDSSGVVTTVAGVGTLGYSGDGGPATSAQLWLPSRIAVDGAGNVFIADYGNHRVRKVDAATGTITTVAGNGLNMNDGDGGAATSASIGKPDGIAIDGLGNLYIAAETSIRRVDAATGLIGSLQPTFIDLRGIDIDSAGNLFVADRGAHRIWRVDPGGAPEVVAGGGNSFPGDGGSATSAQLSYPNDVSVDPTGNLFIADTDHHLIRRVDATTNNITTVAGSSVGFSGDGGVTTSAQLNNPTAVVVDASGAIHIADYRNNRIRSATAGTIETTGGTGLLVAVGGAATSVPVGVYDVAVAPDGTQYLTNDLGSLIYRITADGTLSVFAGTGVQGTSGDGGPALAAQLSTPTGIAVNGAGNVYFCETTRVRKIDVATGIITTVAGGGAANPGDGGQATSASLFTAWDVAIDSAGHLYIAEAAAGLNRHRVRRVDATTGTITTIAGTGAPGFNGDGMAATSAQLNFPRGVAVDSQGNVYIADTLNQRVRKVSAGTITTLAGTGTAGFNGDGQAAASAQLSTPVGVAVDANGDVYIADSTNHRVRRVSGGPITTVAGTGTTGFSGDGAAATAAKLGYPQGVALDAVGHLLIAEDTGHVRRIDQTTNVMTTVIGPLDPRGMGAIAQARFRDPRALFYTPSLVLVAGGVSGTVQALRDGQSVDVVAGRYPHQPATANLARFRDLAFADVGGLAYDDAAKTIYITQRTTGRIDAIDASDSDPNKWTIATIANTAGNVGHVDGAAASARFDSPTGLYLDATARVLYVADTGNHVIRRLDLMLGQVTTIAGTRRRLGFAGDDGPATSAYLSHPQAIARCPNGDLFIADAGNHRVRRIAGGTITTVIGVGEAGSSGQGFPAREFPINAPVGVACDPSGNVFATSSNTVRYLPANPGGVVDGFGAAQTIYGAAPRTTFPATVTRCLTGIVADATHARVVDACTGILIELQRPTAP